MLSRAWQAKGVKMWQRLCIVRAAREMVDAGPSHRNDRYAEFTAAFKRHGEIILRDYADMVPYGLTVDNFMAASIEKPTVPLEGCQMWKNIYEPTCTRIVNVFCQVWSDVKPAEIPSGTPVLDWDEILLSFRIALWEAANNISPSAENTVDVDETPDSLIVPVEKKPRKAKTNHAIVPQNVLPTPLQPKTGRPTKAATFDPSWFPIEWLVFLDMGPDGRNPWARFQPGVGSGPSATLISAQQDSNTTSRAETRKRNAEGNFQSLVAPPALPAEVVELQMALTTASKLSSLNAVLRALETAISEEEDQDELQALRLKRKEVLKKITCSI